MKRFLQVLLTVAVMMIFSPAMAVGFDGGEYIEEEGIVYYDGQSPNAMRRIAIMDAYRYLSERIDDIHVSSNATVRSLRDLDDVINTKVETVLRGARVMSVTRESDGSFHAIVRLYLNGKSNSLASAVLGESIEVEDFPPPKITNIVSGNYSGLIIDCRGKNLSTAIAPVIKSVDGTEIYAYKNLGYQTVVSKGMIAYSTSMDSGVERAGSSPFVVKAVGISGECDVIVSAEDADIILESNKSAQFLN
ncbi:MAG: LPP20 family lipoprotein, partial [Selenomonadaceae bacterium]|nr:LPP20 family lipoprotein [Selenomonadaceae bacterium]